MIFLLLSSLQTCTLSKYTQVTTCQTTQVARPPSLSFFRYLAAAADSNGLTGAAKSGGGTDNLPSCLLLLHVAPVADAATPNRSQGLSDAGVEPCPPPPSPPAACGDVEANRADESNHGGVQTCSWGGGVRWRRIGVATKLAAAQSTVTVLPSRSRTCSVWRCGGVCSGGRTARPRRWQFRRQRRARRRRCSRQHQREIEP